MTRDRPRESQLPAIGTTVAIVQAEPPPGCPRHKLARRLGGKSLLEWVVRRVTDCQLIDQVVVACGSGAERSELDELVPPDVPIFTGSQDDVLARFRAVLDAYPAGAIIRVCADNPFIDPVLIDRLVSNAAALPGCDYLSYRLADGRPAVQSSVGLFAEWIRAEALVRADAEATDVLDRRLVTRYLYSRPEQFDVHLIPTPSPLDRDDLRLTVNLEEDWENAEVIFEALGPDEIDWRRIAGLLDQQPALRQRMATLNRLHAGA